MAEPKSKTEDAAEEEPSADVPAWKGSLSAKKPIVAPDGHENLSQEDIDNRA